jgi:hypothetical protein
MWLKVLSTEGDSVRLSWGNHKGPYPLTYQIGMSSVRRMAGRVRKCLNDLALWGARDEDRSRLPQLLYALAKAGYELRYSLFESMTEPEAAKAVQEWIAEERAVNEDNVLSITATREFHVPWGLVFDHDPPQGHGAEGSITDFGDFWSLKYSLSTTLAGYGYSSAKLIRQADRCRVLSLVNDEVVQQIGKGAVAELGPIFQELLSRPIGHTRTYDECKQRVSEASPGDTVFHFFGHQNNDELVLSSTEQISVIRFKMLLDTIIEKSGGRSLTAGLVFISACGGAFGDGDYSFVDAANREGMCGLISTESAVPRDFAANFAVKFMHKLLIEGASIGQAMTALRHDASLWPLSLLYGCYAQPEYRFAQPKKQPIASAEPSKEVA